MTGQRAWLLEWNPEQFGERWCSYKVDEEERNVLILSEYASCNCGNLWEIQPGDRVFLIRLDREPRGIVAGGMALSKVMRQALSNPVTGECKNARSVYVRLEKMEYRPDRFIPMDRLENIDPLLNWSSVCFSLPPEAAKRLESWWAPRSLQGESMAKSFFEDILRGQSAGWLQILIDELRHEIWRCETLLSEQIREEGVSHRGLSSRLKAAYRNLDRARQELTAAGGVFVPTEEEQGDDEINGKLSTLSRVSLNVGGETGRVEYSASKKEDGFFTVAFREENRREREEAQKDLRSHKIEVYSLTENMTECARAGFRGKVPADDFLSGLAALHIGRWKEDYGSYRIGDRSSWGVMLEFEDGSYQYYRGSLYEDSPRPSTLSGICSLLKAPSPDSWFY